MVEDSTAGSHGSHGSIAERIEGRCDFPAITQTDDSTRRHQ